MFERNRALAEVQRTLAAPIDDQWEHHLGGARIKSPRSGRWPKPKQFGSTVWNRKEILKMYLNTTWRPTHSTVSVKGKRVDGIHCSSMAIRYVLENQGVLGEGWKVEADDLEKVKDKDWVAYALLTPCDVALREPWGQTGPWLFCAINVNREMGRVARIGWTT